MTHAQEVRQLIREALARRPIPENHNRNIAAQEDAAPHQKISREQALADEKTADMKANRGLRDRYAKYAFRLAFGCLVMWWVMITAQGVGKAIWNVELWTPAVMIAVTTGVTVNVLAAFLGVIRGLFGKMFDR